MSASPASSRVRRAAPPKSRRGWNGRWTKYAAAAPSLLAILGMVLFAFLAIGDGPQQMETRYEADAPAALNAGDYQNARIDYLRLLQQKQGDPQLMFGLSRALFGCKQYAAAQSLLNYLAPTDASGYPPAQLFLAQIMLQDPHASTQVKALAEKHLNRVLEKEPQNIDARMLLAAIHEKSS